MIISHKHKFIFIKTEKTAGTSLEIALSEYCGPEDVISLISPKDEQKRKDLGYRGAQNYHVSYSKYKKLDWAKLLIQGKRASFHSHMPAEEIKDLIEPKTWDSYFKFSFERNPWDKFVSWYYWRNRNGKYDSINHFIEEGMGGKVKGFELYTIGGKLAVDKVYKYEEMDEALKEISATLKFDKPLSLPNYVAKGGARKERKHFSELLSEPLLEYIDLFAAREIKLMGYQR